ncbi:MAG: DedA family protein, partial [Blastomonas fulva]
MNDFILNLVASGGYWGVALLMALENVFPPIPSELIMGLAGIEAGKGHINLWAVILAGTVG